MGRIPAPYLVNRLTTLVLTILIAASIIWVIPRLSPVDPAEIALGRMAAGAGAVANSEEILAQLRANMGIDQPMIVQYFKYMSGALVFDFGLSTAAFPTPVST
ncbi:MAG: ABC transporter permease, partial [Pseudomonadota bacterium]